MNKTEQHTACIIGGGMSGLFTGALLAKNGYKVTVLEKNHIIGGGLQSFRRGDAVFNTGLQAFCGYDKGFALHHLFKYFGFDKGSIHIVPLDRDAQEIVWTDTEHCYHLPKTRAKYEAYLISQFPDQADGIHKLLDDIYEIGSTFDYFWLHPMQRHAAAAKYGVITARQLLEQHLSDEQLLRLFEYVGMHLGYNLSVLPATELGMILNLYIEGGWRIAGGNIQLADLLASFINEHNGNVLNDAEVCGVETKDKFVTCVKTTDGRSFEADTYVCAMPPEPFIRMTGDKVLRLSSQERIHSFQNDASCCICHIRTKEHTFKHQNHLIFIPTPSQDQRLPHYISMLTPPEKEQSEWAKTIEILHFMRYSDFASWDATKTGNRGAGYEHKKEEIAHRIINYVAHYYPDIENAIDKIYVSTPLTIRDYYNNPLGAAYSQQGLFLPIKTKVANLFLTGQAIQYQGLFGVATTSIATAETILGRSLIEEIAKA